jgi:hypothetical protein
MNAFDFVANMTSGDSIPLPPEAVQQIPHGAAMRVILLFDLEGPSGAEISGGGELQLLTATGVPDLGVAEDMVSKIGDQSEIEQPDADQCPPASSSEERLRELAIRLRGMPGVYWRSFGVIGIEALMGWTRFRCKCVYCCKGLAEPNHMLGLGTTDHLLPRGRYPELDFLSRDSPRNYLNAVPCCFSCNRIKRATDPNELGSRLYEKGIETKQLTPEMQIMLIDRARRHIDEKRELLRKAYRNDCGNWEKIEREIGGD